MRGISWKRHQDRRIIAKRKKYRPSTLRGVLRKSHLGCGCSMCKPWKHGWENKTKQKYRLNLTKDRYRKILSI